MESGEQKALPTAVLVWIEIAFAIALIIPGVLLTRSGSSLGVTLSVLGTVAGLLAPVTVGVLWESPRTSDAVRLITTIYCLMPVAGLLAMLFYSLARGEAMPDGMQKVLGRACTGLVPFLATRGVMRLVKRGGRQRELNRE